MKTIPFASGLDFPLDVVTQKLAFLARSGAGKSYAAGVLIEGLLRDALSSLRGRDAARKIASASAAIRRLQSDRRTLLDALDLHGEHLSRCAASKTRSNPESYDERAACDCGLDEALRMGETSDA